MAKLKAIYKKPQFINDGDLSQQIHFNLGKATRRGIKKCPGCGYINGSRCYICKNPLCNKVLKDANKLKIHIDSVKLITGTIRQIYSVRIRDKGPDQRGFVQLAHNQYYTKYPTAFLNVSLCFVSNCKQFDNSILKCHEEYENYNTNCIHIESALKSLSITQVIDFKHDLINHLKVADSIKKNLCSLANHGEGPLVQRISKNVMVIKCFVNSKNPLGFLHFTLHFKKNPATNEDEIESFYCVCSPSNNANPAKCLHYYACICAFASDKKLVQDYASFVQNDFVADSLISYHNLQDVNLNIVPLNQSSIGLHSVGSDSEDTMQHKQNDCIEPIEIISNELIDKIINDTEESEHASETNDSLSFDDWMTSVIEKINDDYLTTKKENALIETELSCNIEESTINFRYIQESLNFYIPDQFFKLFRNKIEQITKKYLPDEVNTLDEATSSSNVTIAYKLSDLSLVTQLFKTFAINMSGVNHLTVSCDKPFIIQWTANVYKISNFGELKFIFTRSY